MTPCALFSILCFALCLDAVAADFRVEANRIRVVKRSLYLDMVVWNCSRQPVAPQLADLPWGENAIGLVVYAAGPRGGQPLVEVGPISDFPMKEVKIPPRNSVAGTINISRLFPALSRYSRYDDLMLFWVYDMSLIQGGERAYVGGMLPFIQPTFTSSTRSPANPCN